MKIEKLNENVLNEDTLNEEHPIAKRIFQDLDDIEYFCKQTYEWKIPEWNNRKKVEFMADLIVQYATDIKDALDEFYS